MSIKNRIGWVVWRKIKRAKEWKPCERMDTGYFQSHTHRQTLFDSEAAAKRVVNKEMRTFSGPNACKYRIQKVTWED